MDQPASDRKTWLQRADKFALTGRILARLIKKETSMTFGKWRTQIAIITALQTFLTSKVCHRFFTGKRIIPLQRQPQVKP
ncbi:hypothetical protein [Shewanella phaeophyticola]|uniref:Uncharacterized protein n=1 Tax=Shewanella phaeophyticola TaxID=2978345 RepID=A0ABT2P724_9GAMM|nr:hypothetical protein [Shewanella sp. KJ10-1]MCT8988453.1 hypothetical protein [Shewanella sp. KJ10-1]